MGDLRADEDAVETLEWRESRDPLEEDAPGRGMEVREGDDGLSWTREADPRQDEESARRSLSASLFDMCLFYL